MQRPPSKAEKALAKKIKTLRGEKSQVQYAKIIGLSQSTLNRIENCEQSVTLYLLERIAGKLKVDIKKLIDD